MAIGALFEVATMDWGKISGWIEEHPFATGAIVFGGGLALLYLFGFIGGGSAAAPAANNSAAAFYGAEAAQSQAGAAIQLGTLQTQAATAQAKIQADAATAIAATGASMQTTINGQNTGSANTIAGYEAATSQYAASTQLQATASNNATVLAQTISNNDTAARVNDSNNNATIWQTAMNTIIPQEMVFGGGHAQTNLGEYGTFWGSSGTYVSPTTLAAQGFSPADIAAYGHFVTTGQ
jgi:hypothetical protein